MFFLRDKDKTNVVVSFGTRLRITNWDQPTWVLMRRVRPTTHSYRVSGTKIENITQIHQFVILQGEFSLKWWTKYRYTTLMPQDKRSERGDEGERKDYTCTTTHMHANAPAFELYIFVPNRVSLVELIVGSWKLVYSCFTLWEL